ncbi:MAG: D-alanyl-D-alanine carboxypeptidase family protein [Clostridia bacterium]
MKKIFIFFMVCLLLVLGVGGGAIIARTQDMAYADTQAVTNQQARSAYLVDYNTGTVLYERNPEEKRPIASMVKIMTLVIAFDNIDKGNLSLDQKITVSETAAGMGGSQMFLDAHKEYSVSDLIKGIVISSANDASVALAEVISGSKEEFVSLMNSTAKEMGMQNTVFVNVTGLPAPGQYSTAKDVTIMMRELLKTPAYYDYSHIYMEDFTHPDGRITELVNTNKLVRFYKGCDAGKTGFTNDAMFCLSASAMRNDMRVIATVIHSPDSKSRFAEVSSLFNYAFANYKQEKVVAKGELLKEIKLAGGKSEKLSVASDESLYILQKRGEKSSFSLKVDLPDKVRAPLKKGDALGTVTVVSDTGEILGEARLVAMQDAPKKSFGDSLKDIIENWFY